MQRRDGISVDSEENVLLVVGMKEGFNVTL